MAEVKLLQALDYADPENLGGASRVALSLGAELVAMGWRVECVAGREGEPGSSTVNGIMFRHFTSRTSENQTFWKNIKLLGSRVGIRAGAKSFSPEVLLFHQPFVTWILRPLLNRVPFVYFFHSPWSAEYLARKKELGRSAFVQIWMRVALERWALGKADLILAASEFMRGKLFEYHPLPRLLAKTEIIPHGVDTAHFRPRGSRAEARARLGLPAARPIVITTRRLEARMGLEELVRAVALCRRRFPDIFLVVVGRGRLDERLKRLAGECGLSDSVRFWGYAPDELLPVLYTAADLFVLPTQALEGFGLVILEAASCGLPVVATPVGAIPEVLRPFGREFVVRDTDAGALAEGIERGLRVRPEERIRWRERVLENHSWRKCAERFAEKARILLLRSQPSPSRL